MKLFIDLKAGLKALILSFSLLIVCPDLIGQTVTVLDENFDASSSIPSNWTQEVVVGTTVWTINNGGTDDMGVKHPSAAYSGTRNAFFFSTNTTHKRKLVTPSLNLSGLGNVTLTFYEAREYWGGTTDQDELKIYYKTSAAGSWAQIAYYTANTPSWTLRTVTLPSPSATYYVAFEGIAKYGYGVCVDDVKITAQLALDASVFSIFVDNKKQIKATVKNYGTSTLTSFNVNWKVDNGSTSVYNWSGSLASGNTSSAITLISNYNFSHGTHTISAWTSSPNGGGDGNTSNDSLQVSYLIVKTFPYAESFETGLNFWKQGTGTSLDWTRYSGSTPTANTGPSGAYDGTYYVYTEASGNYNKTALLVSPDLDLTSMTNPYLQYWYHMYGNNIGILGFDADTLSENWVYNVIARDSGNQGNVWLSKLVNLSGYKKLNRVRFRGVTGNGFLSDIAVDDIKVFDKPIVNLGNDVNICLGDTVRFDAGTGVGWTYEWKKIGTTGTLSTTRYLTVNSSGNYYITITGSFGYTASDTVSVSIRPMPDAVFSINDSDQCRKQNNFIFTNSSAISAGTMTYSWNFGDNTSSSQTNPSHQYLNPGTYPVRLIAVSNYGCKDTLIKNVYVYQSPDASFTIANNSQCLTGNLFQFNNTSTINPGSITSAIFYFGDGNSSSSTNPSHAYTVADSFSVKLKTISNNGCPDSVIKKVYVRPVPDASFSINDSTQCSRGHVFSFSNLSTLTYGTMSYSWNFGDGNSSTLSNPTKTYTSAGTYAVRLIATTNYLCKDTLVKNVHLYPTPVASFSIANNSQCLNGNLFQFSNSSTVSSGSIADKVYYFGDGDSIHSDNPSHTYKTADSFSVKLKIKSDKGCFDSTSKKAYVHPMPDADFTINNSSQCLKGNNFLFTNLSTIKYGTMNYAWDFGDANTSTLSNPAQKYNTPGTYNVRLIASSNYNCKDTLQKTVNVSPMPAARFIIGDSTQCLKYNKFSYTNLSSVSSGSINYTWTFGNGDVSTFKNPINTYTSPGSYNVMLIATTNNGCKDTSQSVNHVYPMPVASFSTPDPPQCLESNIFTFNNSSSLVTGTLNYVWHFGDGITSSLTSPVYNYTYSDTFNVLLVAISDQVCFDSTTGQVIVWPQPQASFTANSMNQCFTGNNFIFNNTSSIKYGTLSHFWYFGDGDTSGSEHPVHSYDTTGTFPVILISTSDLGCKDTFVRNAGVAVPPVADFDIITDSIQCLNENFFIFQSIGDTLSENHFYYWYRGDGRLAEGENDSFSYPYPGKYIVSLVVFVDNNCKDSFAREVRVLPSPVISLGKDTLLPKKGFLLLDPGSGFATYLWHDNSGLPTWLADSTSLIPDSNVIYVTVSDSNGCTGTDTIIIFYDTTTVGLHPITSAFDFRLFPTIITDGKLFAEFFGDIPFLSMQIIDIQGKCLYDENFSMTNGYLKEIDVTNLTRGSYLISLRYGNKVFVRKIIVQ